jgi:hypothetical protein
VTIYPIGATVCAGPHYMNWTGTRRETIPARRGLDVLFDIAIASGDARSRQLDPVPTTRPVASHHSSPVVPVYQSLAS